MALRGKLHSAPSYVSQIALRKGIDAKFPRWPGVFEKICTLCLREIRSLFTEPQRLNINGRHVFHRDRSSASCKIIKLANEIQLKTAVLRNRETITIEPVRLRYNWINERSGPCNSTVSLYEFTITTRQKKRSLAGFTIDRSKISNVCRCSSISKVVRNSQCRGISYAKHGRKLAYLLL